jgi:hypothetical protein
LAGGRPGSVGDIPYDAVYIGIKTKQAASNGSTRPGAPTIDEQTAKIIARYLAASQGK